jgi:hypothetical protein
MPGRVEIDDVHGAGGKFGVIAEMIEQIADNDAVTLRDQCVERRRRSEAVAAEQFRCQARVGGVAQCAQVFGELMVKLHHASGIGLCSAADLEIHEVVRNRIVVSTEGKYRKRASKLPRRRFSFGLVDEAQQYAAGQE